MIFNAAQVFWVDKSLVAGASTVGLTAVDLFFVSKPFVDGNRSGIESPGAWISLLPVQNNVPVLDEYFNAARVRVAYEKVLTSADASLATTFRFTKPAPVMTNTDYALLVWYDGNEDYVLWLNNSGDTLLDSGNPSTGSTDAHVGPFYSYIGSPGPVLGPTLDTGQGVVNFANGSGASGVANSQLTASAWKPLNNTKLKFNVYAARYTVAGSANLAPVLDDFEPANSQIFTPPLNKVANGANGDILISLPSARYEYCVFDNSRSSPQAIKEGERAFQVGPYFPGGVANPAVFSVSEGSDIVTCTNNGVNFNNTFNLGGSDPTWVVLYSANQNGANADVCDIKKVLKVVTNTSFQVDSNVVFTNTACYMQIAPVAKIDQFVSGRFFGASKSLVVLTTSHVNSSIRFVNNTITNTGISSNGTGYANTDYVTFTGFESVAGKVIGGYAAKANVVTNGNGAITQLNFSNLGCGFINTGNIVLTVSNSTGGSSNGSGLALTYTTGAVIKTQFIGQNTGGGVLVDCSFVNMEDDFEIVNVTPAKPPSVFYTISQRLPYYSLDDTSVSGNVAYYCDSDAGTDVLELTNLQIHRPFDYTKRRILPSFSNEFHIPYANGTACQAAGGSTLGNVEPFSSNSSVLVLDVFSNNDFNSLSINANTTKLTVIDFIINNDYTGENTNKGNALAKGVEVKFNLNGNVVAEDIQIFTDVYQPPNTQVIAFIKVYNNADPEPFNDKDWTMMRLIGGQNVYSSPTDATDVIELTWALPQYPNTSVVVSGYVTTSNNSNVVTSTGANFGSLTAGELVKIYPPLFPNNYQISVVGSVTNTSQITITDPVTNNGVLGSGLVMEVIGYPHQAFNNILNDNVARYYNGSMSPFDRFDTAQVKLVFLSSDGLTIPDYSDVRAVAISA